MIRSSANFNPRNKSETFFENSISLWVIPPFFSFFTLFFISRLHLRTQHGQLNSHLRRIGVTLDRSCPFCPCPDETMEHHLFECPSLADLRAEHLPLNPTIENTYLFCHVIGSKGESPKTCWIEMNEWISRLGIYRLRQSMYQIKAMNYYKTL